MKKLFLAIFLITLCRLSAAAQDTLSITLENVKYPYPVDFLNLQAEGQDFRMAYMDVKPERSNGETFLLLHGKNFGGYYWGNVIKALTAKGYRVIVPDQVGFGKSSKPFIHYSFHVLAGFTKRLLDTLGVRKVMVLGHSMGGMLATRFALMYPERTSRLLLEDPIGLEDYRTFVPYVSTEDQYKTELKTTPESVKKYYQNSYFPQWKPEYDYLVRIGGGVAKSGDFPRYAKVAAMTFTMIYEQPVVYELPLIEVPSVLFVGKEDRTIVGKGLLSEEMKSKHGQYQLLGKEISKKIPGCKLVEFEGVGHIPHIQIPDEFIKALLRQL